MLLREPVIARETASGTWLETEKWLRGQGILPERLHILARMENPDAIRRAVARGMGGFGAFFAGGGGRRGGRPPADL